MAKGKTPKHLMKWQRHLNKVRKDNPNLTMKEAMKKASKSFKR